MAYCIRLLNWSWTSLVSHPEVRSTFLKLVSNDVTPLSNSQCGSLLGKSTIFSLKVKVLHHQLLSHLFIFNSGLYLCETFSPSPLPSATEQQQTLANLPITSQFLTFWYPGTAFNLGRGPQEEHHLLLRSGNLLLHLHSNLRREGATTNTDITLQAESQTIGHLRKWIWVVTSQTGFLSIASAQWLECRQGGPSRRSNPSLSREVLEKKEQHKEAL